MTEQKGFFYPKDDPHYLPEFFPAEKPHDAGKRRNCKKLKRRILQMPAAKAESISTLKKHTMKFHRKHCFL